jgi:hypothetical protein
VANVDILANPEMAAAASRVTRRGGGRRAQEEEVGEGTRMVLAGEEGARDPDRR